MDTRLENLQHVSVPVNNLGAVVYVLDTGAVIDAESEAMLQALHSRSTGGLKGHLEILAKRGADKFMSSFYVGYGHKSIGDCGTATLFIEGVSMLAAKAIQDWPLYSGQEASTRYIDFQKQRFHNPLNTTDGEQILETWRKFYVESLDATREDLKQRFPKQVGEEEKTYEKAISARAFDTLRGVLPAGATTNLAWHTNLRQAADKLMTLRHHPLSEVRDIAVAIEKGLQEMFPNSFYHKKYDATEAYNKKITQEHYYFHDKNSKEFEVLRNGVNRELLPREVLETRPPKTELPKYMGEAGTITFAFTLDFGSFRDVQRHRAVTQRMPLLTTDLGFHPWYLGEMSESVRTKLITLLTTQENAINALNATPEEKQYYTAMGYNTSNRMTGDVGNLVYLAELRATRFVHPTLRERAKQIAHYLKQEFGDQGLVIHLDEDSDRFDVKRGEHDIQLKEN